jgi:hypothetical protein
MGDIGEYWREHKEYVNRKKYGKPKKRYDWLPDNRLPKVLQCECGTMLPNIGAHNQHKSVKGKSGHSLITKQEQ